MVGAPWVVLCVHWRQEDVATRNLENQGAECYLPRALVRGRTHVLSPQPLFPGYAFARHPEGRWSFMRSTRGVKDIMLMGTEAVATVTDAVIRGLRAREHNDGLIHLGEEGFDMGERVKVDRDVVIMKGIYDGTSGPDRVFVLLEFLGGTTRAEVDIKDVTRE